MKISQYILLIIGIFCSNSLYAQDPCGRGNENSITGNGKESFDPNPSANGETEAVQPIDPNEIVGTDGWMVIDEWGDTVRWVSATQSLPYTVYFENDPLMATAAAQVVTVRLKLHPLMNIADFRVGTFGFGNHVFPVEGSPLQYQTRLDLVEEMNLFVDVVAGIDITTNEAFWIFSSIDPITGIAPTESDRGFLAVNDSTHVGEGFVTFSIKPIADRCHTGDTIGVQASIVFDVNEAIETNRWVNTVDAVAPVSSCTVLASETLAHQDSISVAFSGDDDATGVAAYRLYYTENGSAFHFAGRYMDSDTAVLASQPNTIYSFLSLGEDMVGNIEPMKGEPDTLFGNTSVRLLASVWPDGAGSITGTGSYTLGDTANIFVQPAEGYRLLRWTEGGVPQGTDALLTVVAEQNHNYTAEMIQMSYPLTVMAAEGTTIAVTTRTAAGEMPAYQSVQHFDTLDIHIEASPCYGNVSFSLNGLPFAADTMLVVHEAVSLSSAATPQVDTGYVYDTVCRNSSYTANGFNILSSATATSGIAYFQLSILNSDGCDSVSRLSLYVKPSHTLTFLANGGEGTMPSQQVCDREETVLNMSSFSREGFFFAGWDTTADADSSIYVDGGIITANVDMTLYAVWNSNCVDREVNSLVSVCDSYTWEDSTYTASGEYVRTKTSVLPGGCDSIYRLLLTVKHSTELIQEVNACHPYTWIDGQTYTTDTTRQISITNAVGCDSLVILHLSVAETITVFDTVVACDSVVWNGTTWYAGSLPVANPIHTTTNDAGCDSETILYLTINQSSHSVDSATACDSYTFGDSVYTASRLLAYHLTNSVGCDSTSTIYLTVNHSSSAIDSVVACNSFVWHGVEYSASTDSASFTCLNAMGCDSVTTLHLTIDLCSTTEIVACDSFAWHGVTYTESGVYTDETDTLLLTVNFSSASVDSVVACDSYTFGDSVYTASRLLAYHLTNSVGCDSTSTIYLTVNHSSSAIDSVVTCNSFVWHGVEYSASTDSASFTCLNAMGCDSVTTLHLTIDLCSTTEIVACDSFAWHGVSYTESGVYNDETDTLLLTVNYSSASVDSVVACDYYTFGDSVYTSSRLLAYHSTNSMGCDSTSTIYLNINHSSSAIDSVAACNFFVWHGVEYSASTDSATFTCLNAMGCDSVTTLHLTIDLCSTTEIVACDSFAWHGVTYTESGVYTDVTDTLLLTVNFSSASVDSVVACDYYTFGDSVYTASRLLAYHLTGADGCDSSITVYLIVNQSIHIDTTVVACDGYFWNGMMYNISGNYVRTEANVSGCDSTKSLHLTVNHSTSFIDIQTACENYTWIDGVTYTESTDPQAGDTTYGSVTPAYHTTNTVGCDSTITLHLTINTPVLMDVYDTTCDSYVWNDSTYTSSGEHVQIRRSVLHELCDTVETLHLTVKYSSSSDTSVVACDSYTFGDSVYTASRLLAYHLTNSEGCDSLVTVYLTVNQSSTCDTTVIACDSFTWYGGATWYAGSLPAANPTHTITNGNRFGCDSTVTLLLTVNSSTSFNDIKTACENYTWIDGVTYTTSTGVAGEIPVYHTTNAAGCDSTITLQLTINTPVLMDVYDTTCDSYVWNDSTYTLSGEYVQTRMSVIQGGCDTVETLHLTVYFSSTGVDSLTACDSITWNGVTYTASRMLAFNLTNSEGCDSLVTVYLTVNYSSDTTVTDSSDGNYIWHGENYTESGTYQWQGTTDAGCDSTVTLLLVINPVGIEEIENSKLKIDIYPNPTIGVITIDADDVLSVEVFDQTGHRVLMFGQSDNTIPHAGETTKSPSINLSSLPTGTYLLKIHTQRGNAVRRVILK